MKFATNPDDIIHLTFGILLYYLGKLKFQFSADIEEKNKQIAFLIGSTFVIHSE